VSLGIARTLVVVPHSCDVEHLVNANNMFEYDDRCDLGAETIDALI
jgi:hypothetical protein